MTTIAIRGSKMAADSFTTANGIIHGGSYQKIFKAGNVLIAAAGTVSVCKAFSDWVRGGMLNACPITDDSSTGIIVAPKFTVKFDLGGPHLCNSPFYALGSGSELALGAMAMGASAEEAVKAAITLDVYSGGPVIVLALDDHGPS